MRGYDGERNDYGDYYEDEGQEEYEEEGEEEYEEEEEEPRKPSKEELEYLELRQKLKESIRKQMKKESTGSNSSRSESTDRRGNKLPYDNYGSYFGPSQPVIAQRVIQESKSLLENQHLAPRISNPHHVALKVCQDDKIQKQLAKEKAQNRRDLGSFCEQFGLPSCPTQKKKYSKKEYPKKETKPKYGNKSRRPFRKPNKDNLPKLDNIPKNPRSKIVNVSIH